VRGWLPAPVFNVKVKVNTVGVGPHRLGGRPIAATPQDPPGSFTARYRWDDGHVPAHWWVAQIQVLRTAFSRSSSHRSWSRSVQL